VSLTLAREAPSRARRELVTTWAICIALIALAKLVGMVEPTGVLGANLAGVAAFLFVVLPERKLHPRGERWTSFGFPWWGARDARTWRAWLAGLGAALLVCAVVFPLFLLLFWGYARLLPSLPAGLAAALAPYLPSPGMTPRLRFPAKFPLAILVQLLVVALPEELFYRGWMQTTWAATGPGRRVRVLGADLGRGFLATQVLFATGHLVVFQVWRLGTFFPGLLFGWLRERTGNLAAPIFLHALSNLFLAVLEASFYG
jgi:membrane protease YdiL (CAAX protease family)